MKPRRLLIAAALLIAASLLAVTAYARGHQSSASGVFFASMTGAQEVQGHHPNQGDPDAVGGAVVQIDDDTATLCFGITVDNLDQPIASHIHIGPAGVAGPIVVPLTAPSTGNPGASSGCVQGVAPDLLASIKSNPAGFYVNVHTTAYPGGAVRGQLVPAS
jgi:hypothetical protein